MENLKQLIFEEPEKWRHLREIARRLNKSPGTVKKYLDKLNKEKIVQIRKEGNLVQFRADFESENYQIEKRIYNLNAIYKSGIVEKLWQTYLGAIVLFGSYSRGEDTSESDIDVGVVTASKKSIELKNFEKKLKRRIQLSLFTKKDVSEEFYNSIINGIILKGVLK